MSRVEAVNPWCVVHRRVWYGNEPYEGPDYCWIGKGDNPILCQFESMTHVEAQRLNSMIDPPEET